MATTTSVTIQSIEELEKAADELLAFAGDKKVFTFYGEMGAGKTTFINTICKKLGVTSPTSSPTYAIVNEYTTQKNKHLYHFDFYRLKSEAEAYDLGYEDYIYSGNYCFIEWPEKIASLLPSDCVRINISVNENKRVFLFEF